MGGLRWEDGKGGMRTLSVHGHVQVADGAVCAEDFAEVGFGYVFGEFFDDHLFMVSVSKVHFQNMLSVVQV